MTRMMSERHWAMHALSGKQIHTCNVSPMQSHATRCLFSHGVQLWCCTTTKRHRRLCTAATKKPSARTKTRLSADSKGGPAPRGVCTYSTLPRSQGCYHMSVQPWCSATVLYHNEETQDTLYSSNKNSIGEKTRLSTDSKRRSSITVSTMPRSQECKPVTVVSGNSHYSKAISLRTSPMCRCAKAQSGLTCRNAGTQKPQKTHLQITNGKRLALQLQ